MLSRNTPQNNSYDSFDMNLQQIESTNNILSNIENKLNSFLSKKPAAAALAQKSSKLNYKETQSGQSNRTLEEKRKKVDSSEEIDAPEQRKLFNNELIAKRILTKNNDQIEDELETLRSRLTNLEHLSDKKRKLSKDLKNKKRSHVQPNDKRELDEENSLSYVEQKISPSGADITLDREIGVLEKLKKIEGFYQNKQNILEEKIKGLETDNLKLVTELSNKHEDLERWRALSKEHEQALDIHVSALKRELDELRSKLEASLKREKTKEAEFNNQLHRMKLEKEEMVGELAILRKHKCPEVEVFDSDTTSVPNSLALTSKVKTPHEAQAAEIIDPYRQEINRLKAQNVSLNEQFTKEIDSLRHELSKVREENKDLSKEGSGRKINKRSGRKGFISPSNRSEYETDFNYQNYQKDVSAFFDIANIENIDFDALTEHETKRIGNQIKLFLIDLDEKYRRQVKQNKELRDTLNFKTEPLQSAQEALARIQNKKDARKSSNRSRNSSNSEVFSSAQSMMTNLGLCSRYGKATCEFKKKPQGKTHKSDQKKVAKARTNRTEEEKTDEVLKELKLEAFSKELQQLKNIVNTRIMMKKSKDRKGL